MQGGKHRMSPTNPALKHPLAWILPKKQEQAT